MDDQAQKKRGKLKVFLGYAAGVGKTYRMLEEAHDLKEKGIDVVIGYFEPHGRQDTIEKTKGIELIPRRRINYRGSVFEEMDTEAILQRKPQKCLVDEFAHTNVPGSERIKRWEDVLILLDAHIDVLTNMNIQHLESLTDQVFQITGVQVRETVPDWILKQADEIVMVDLTAGALIHRLERGAVYSPDKVEYALHNFFKESNMVALRELALRQAAHEVDVRQQDKHDENLIANAPIMESGLVIPEEVERFLIYVTVQPSTALLIRRAWRMADYLRAECLAVHVRPRNETQARREIIEKHLNFARDLHIETRVLDGEDITQTVIQFARVQRITHIFMLRPQYSLWEKIRSNNVIHEVVRMAEEMRVTIVAEHKLSRIS